MENYFTTTDLGLASALITFGIAYKEAKKLSSERIVFVFDDSTDIKRAVSAYYSNALKVPASTYINNYKSLKGIINGLIKEETKSRRVSK